MKVVSLITLYAFQKFLIQQCFLLIPSLHRLSMFRDAGDGVGADLRRSDQRLVVRRPGMGG